MLATDLERGMIKKLEKGEKAARSTVVARRAAVLESGMSKGL